MNLWQHNGKFKTESPDKITKNANNRHDGKAFLRMEEYLNHATQYSCINEGGRGTDEKEIQSVEPKLFTESCPLICPDIVCVCVFGGVGC